MTKSKITQVVQTGTNTWKDKQLTKWLVVFENQENGTLTTGFNDGDKAPQVGEELEYTITDKGFGPEIVLPKTGGGFKGGGYKKTPEQEANLNAIAVTKSAIEGGLDLKQWKPFYSDSYNYFLDFTKGTQEAPKAEVVEKDVLPF
jgi:hypothetical protein